MELQVGRILLLLVEYKLGPTEISKPYFQSSRILAIKQVITGPTSRLTLAKPHSTEALANPSVVSVASLGLHFR